MLARALLVLQPGVAHAAHSGSDGVTLGQAVLSVQNYAPVPARRLDTFSTGAGSVRITFDTSALFEDAITYTCFEAGATFTVGQPTEPFTAANLCDLNMASSMSWRDCHGICADDQVLTAAKRDAFMGATAVHAPHIAQMLAMTRTLDGDLMLSDPHCQGRLPARKNNSQVPDTDLLIFLTARPVSYEIGAFSYSCETDQHGRTVSGILNYAPHDISKDFYVQRYTLLHEIIHLLGFSIASFPSFLQQPVLADSPSWQGDAPIVSQRIVLPMVVQMANAHFSCDDSGGVFLQDDVFTGAVRKSTSHWEARQLADDVMSYDGGPFISNITLAVLAASGWYDVRYDLADEIHWGRNAGCSMLSTRCSEWEPWEFCSKLWGTSDSNSTSKGQSTQRWLQRYPTPLPPSYQYFNDSHLGGTSRWADYCPFVSPFSSTGKCYCGISGPFSESAEVSCFSTMNRPMQCSSLCNPEIDCNWHGFCNGRCECTCDTGWYGANCTRVCSGFACERLVQFDLGMLAEAEMPRRRISTGYAEMPRRRISTGYAVPVPSYHSSNPNAAYILDRLDRIAIPHDPWALRSAFTASAWVQQLSGSAGALLSFGGISPNSTRYAGLYLGSTTIAFEWKKADQFEGSYDRATWAVNVSDSRWHHIALVVEWPRTWLYVDGNSAGEQIMDSFFEDLSRVLFLGCLHGMEHKDEPCNMWGLTGKVDAFLFYSRALSSIEIMGIGRNRPVAAQNWTGLTSGLLASYDLDTVAIDVANQSIAEVVGATSSSDRGDNSNRAHLFSTFNRIAISHVPWNLDRLFTASAWVQQLSGSAGALISTGGASQESIRHLALFLGVSTISFEWQSTGGIRQHCTWSVTVSDSMWHHIALVVEWPRARLYIDGSNVGEQGMTSFFVDNSKELWIGCLHGTDVKAEPCNTW